MTPATRRGSAVVRAVAVAATLAVCLLVSGCLSVPTSGPVHEIEKQPATVDEGGFRYEPRPPREGATQAEIVGGFLDAMEATPVSTTVAKQYLTEDFADSWDPSSKTVTYADRKNPRGRRLLSVDLSDANWLDTRGAWRGRLYGSDATLRFALAKQDGQWRISQAPNALVVSQSWFETRYAQVSLYFFDPTARVLVPEPVFVPTGAQLATTLVRGLLQGPGARLAGVVRSFLPTGGSEGLSVPVDDGVAVVDITGEGGGQTAQTQQLMAAQLAWTLRQDPSIDRIQLTFDGRPVQFPDSGDTFSVSSGMQFDPTGFAAGTELFAVRNGRTLSSDGGEFEPVSGPWANPQDVAAVVPDPSEQRAAGLSADRSTVLLGPLGDGRVRSSRLTGSDLLPPAWDLIGRVWTVDRSAEGAQLKYLSEGRVRTVRVPGVTGQDVRDFLVSRDGTRFVALVRGRATDRILVSRLQATTGGRVTSATAGENLPIAAQGPIRIGDIAWNSTTSVLALQRSPDTALIHALSVDAATSGFPEGPYSIGGPVRSLVSSPVPDAVMFARAGSNLIDFSGQGEDISVPAGTTEVTYAG